MLMIDLGLNLDIVVKIKEILHTIINVCSNCPLLAENWLGQINFLLVNQQINNLTPTLTHMCEN